MSRESKRETITQNEYWQLIGLKAVYTQLQAQFYAIEQAAFAITQELDHDGSVADYGHTTDWLSGSRANIDGKNGLLDVLKLTVEAPQPQNNDAPPSAAQ